MKIALATAALALLVTPASLRLQAQTQGVSAPPPAINPGPEVTPIPKPSAAVPLQPATQQSTWQPAPTPSSAPVDAMPAPTDVTPGTRQGFDPDAEIVTSVPSHHAGDAQQAVDSDDDVNEGVVTSVRPPEDNNVGVVTYISSDPNIVPVGTLLHARIRETISTATTPEGAPFTAEVTSPLEREGRVIIPAGALIRGRVTVCRGGRRITGGAAIHLNPEHIVLPDGSYYDVRAQIVDTDQAQLTRIDPEGTIIRRDHIKGTLAAMSLTTGGAAAAGAMMGGGVGLVVGAGIGAGISTVWWFKQDRQETVPQHTGLVFDITEPMPITPTMAAIH
jgi:hypothetical protein